MSRTVEAFRSGKKCVILAAPTGFGKSYVNAAFASVSRSFYSTPQLVLMNQIMRDPFLKNRFAEIKGRQNYRCYHNPRRGIHAGICETEDYPCNERFDVCPYWLQKMRALKAQSVLMSLAYLISEGQTEGVSKTYLGTRPLLVIDEGHNIEEQCLDHVSVRVSPFTIPYEVYTSMVAPLRKIKNESQLRELLDSIEARLERVLERMRGVSERSGLSVTQAEEKQRIEQYLASYSLYKSSNSEWVWQIKSDQLLVQPVFAKEFMKQLIWKRGEFFIISSATILNPEEYVDLIGLREFLSADEISCLQVPSTFPVENRPVIDATVGPLSKEELDHNMPKAVLAIEGILRKERGNVAIHCHSYGHQRSLTESIAEDLKPRLIIHTSKNRAEKLTEWMHSRGKVFVSVAFNEGQDWKYDICDAQILLKVPFPYLGDKRVMRRLELGYRQWYANQAMLDV
ncbi:MAG: helicase C-terminal domain-containing protein, partial [archaeon]